VQVDDDVVSGDSDFDRIALQVEREQILISKGLAECVRLIDDATGEILFEVHSNGDIWGDMEEVKGRYVEQHQSD
jgi:hypothetical protein